MPDNIQSALTPQNPPQNPSTIPGQVKQEVGEVAYNVEFNDSVLSTKTWNNPRYDGCQTITQKINTFTNGDVTYGKTSAVQQYSRNIYVGDYIFPTTGSNVAFEGLLTPFPGFSYIASKNIITVNEDDEIVNTLYDPINTDVKEGYYRIFNSDFKPGTKFKIILLNNAIENSLKDNYDVYFSSGRLFKIAHFNNIDQENSTNGSTAGPVGSSTNFIFGEDYTEPFPSFSIFNNPKNPYGGPYGEFTTSSIVLDFFNSTVEAYQEDISNRYFVTLTQGENFPFETGSIGTSLSTPILAQTGSGVIPSLAQISTVEYFALRYSTIGNILYANLSDKYKLYKPYFDQNWNDFGGYPYADAYYLGYYISALDDTLPCILTNLNFSQELPYGLLPGSTDDTGQFHPFGLGTTQGTQFIVIPENIHPYIKDNLNYFLIKANLLPSNQSVTLNPKNRQLS